MFVHLDEILIFSKNMFDHVSYVRQVLQWLLENKLFAKAEKCELHTKTVSFLGYVIESMRTDVEKTKAVAEWPRPG